MLRYALGRLGQIVPIALLVTILIFLLIKLVPGDPASAILGDRASDASIAALRHQWGLDRPIWQQYAIYMRNLLTGNLGISLRDPDTGDGDAAAAGGDHVLLGHVQPRALAPIAVPLAVVAAFHRNRWPDQVIRAAMALPLAAPQFWSGSCS